MNGCCSIAIGQLQVLFGMCNDNLIKAGPPIPPGNKPNDWPVLNQTRVFSHDPATPQWVINPWPTNK